jgi:ABC-2 type transport system ATP-binding protein
VDDTAAVQTVGLVKAYRGVRVLDSVDLTVGRGGVFALLGPNGAGKTTMVRILSTLVTPDGGTARVAGCDVLRERAKVRRSISLTGQSVALDDLQTGLENLTMMAHLAGLREREARRRAVTLLEEFDLAADGHRRVGTYSGGMRRRLDLAAGLTGDPSVVFLDEPTTGLDPRSRLGLWRVVRDLTTRGVTVFLTTQYLEEADHLADRIVVLNAGRIVADGTATSLKQRYASVRLDLVAAGPEQFRQLARRIAERGIAAVSGPADEEPGSGTTTRTVPGTTVHNGLLPLSIGVPTDGSAADVRRLLDDLDPTGETVASFTLHRATLDDVFLALTGRSTDTDDGASVAPSSSRENAHV